MLSQDDIDVENVSTWEDTIEARIDKQDSNFEKMEAKMDKMLELITRQANIISSVETPPVSKVRRLIPFSRGPVTPIANRPSVEPTCEDANFRHRFAQSNESSSAERPQASGSTYYRNRLSSLGDIDQPATDSAIVRSIVIIDPKKSGVLLTVLDDSSPISYEGVKKMIEASFCARDHEFTADRAHQDGGVFDLEAAVGDRDLVKFLACGSDLTRMTIEAQSQVAEDRLSVSRVQALISLINPDYDRILSLTKDDFHVPRDPTFQPVSDPPRL
jgi:hypothetical protein